MNTNNQSIPNTNNRFDVKKKAESHKNDSSTQKASQEQKSHEASRRSQKNQESKADRNTRHATQRSE